MTPVNSFNKRQKATTARACNNKKKIENLREISLMVELEKDGSM